MQVMTMTVTASLRPPMPLRRLPITAKRSVKRERFQTIQT
jgi:hypothetical protein